MNDTQPAGQPNNSEASLSDLEQAFHQEVGQNTPQVQTPQSESFSTPAQGGLKEKIQKLSETKQKINTKVAGLKTEISQKIESFKALKQEVAEKIALVKELEETLEKINKEEEKIAGIEAELSSIEQEAEHELNS